MTMSLAGAASIGLMPALARLQPAMAADDLSVTRLEDGFFIISGGGQNVLVAEGAESALMVDSGNAASAKAILDVIAEETGGKAVETLFNTHWHPENTGGNAAVHAQGGRILAHENTKLWMTTRFSSHWQDKTYEPRPKADLPDYTFYYGEDAIGFDGKRVEYGLLHQAHTDGDIYVRFPEANVIAVGGLMAKGHYPIFDYTTGGWIGGMIRANNSLLEMIDDETRIIAGSGGVLGKADLEKQVEMLDAVFAVVTDVYRSGLGLEEFRSRQPTKEFDAEWGDPELFERLAFDGSWGHVRELGRII